MYVFASRYSNSHFMATAIKPDSYQCDKYLIMSKILHGPGGKKLPIRFCVTVASCCNLNANVVITYLTCLCCYRHVFTPTYSEHSQRLNSSILAHLITR
jgi:hypothetical protein